MKRSTKERHCHICGKVCKSKSHWLLHPETLDFPGRKGKLLDSVKYEFLCFNFPKLRQKDILKRMYLDECLGLHALCDYVGGLDLKAMCFILKYYKIQIRTLAESRKSDSPSQRRIEKTNLQRYGKKNPLSKGTEPWKKRNKTVKDKYGVDNVWQCLHLFVSEHQLGNKISSLNIAIAKILDDLNLEYKKEFAITYINEEDYKKHVKFYDFKILGTNILIEANGDYWHANPKYYSKKDLVKMRGVEIPVTLIWQTDALKQEIANQNGYEVLTFWESEMKLEVDLENVKKQISERISHAKF